MSFELFQAVTIGDLKKLQEALDAGANIEAEDVNGGTPLWLAIEHAHKSAVILLCERGAKLTVAKSDVGTCLTLAVLYAADKTIVDTLIQTKKLAFQVLSHELAFRGNLKKLQSTSQKNPYHPYQDSYLNNELHYAAANGQLETIAWLVQQEFPVAEKNQLGMTPLLLAALNGQLSVVQWLLQHHASLQEKDNKGNTALIWAALHGHLPLIQWLLQNGGNTTKIHMAADAHGLGIIQISTSDRKYFCKDQTFSRNSNKIR